MDGHLRGYLHNLTKMLKLDPGTNREITLEIQGHLEEKIEELREDGLTYQEARATALRDLGRPDLISREMYSVHSIGSWRDILLATLPHLLLASLFALHLWTRYLLVAVVLVGITVVALRGWKDGKSKWAYTWLGYSMAAPALSWVMALVAIGYGTWRYVTTGNLPFSFPVYFLLIAYIPFSLWMTWKVVMRVVRHDWLLVSLTALPFPFLTAWILFLNWQGGLWSANTAKVQETDSDRALVFLALAVTTGVFLKVGHRLVKIGLLTVSTAVLVIFSIVVIPFGFGILSGILVTLASVAFLLSPAFLQSRLERREALQPSVEPSIEGEGEVVTHWFTNGT